MRLPPAPRSARPRAGRLRQCREMGAESHCANPTQLH
jgi:hypothetical protein